MIKLIAAFAISMLIMSHADARSSGGHGGGGHGGGRGAEGPAAPGPSSPGPSSPGPSASGIGDNDGSAQRTNYDWIEFGQRVTMNPGFCTRNAGDYYVRTGQANCGG